MEEIIVDRDFSIMIDEDKKYYEICTSYRVPYIREIGGEELTGLQLQEMYL